MFVLVFVSLIGQPKGKKQIIAMILCAVMFALEAGLSVWYAYENSKKNADTEQITLSDGNKILLRERIGYIRGVEDKFEKKFEYTYMDVYQIKGITAKKLGETGEQYFTNMSLLQDIYTYEYNEENKRLTVSHKNEYDTEAWEKEFILE